MLMMMLQGFLIDACYALSCDAFMLAARLFVLLCLRMRYAYAGIHAAFR